MMQRTILATAILAGAIGMMLPAHAQSTQAGDLQISAQDQQQNSDHPYSDQQLDGLANQINQTAGPDPSSDIPGVYALPNVQGVPNNLVIIDTGLDTSSPQDTIGNYAIGVSF